VTKTSEEKRRIKGQKQKIFWGAGRKLKTGRKKSHVRAYTKKKEWPDD